MPRSRRWTDEEGTASLEFITAGLVLLVPLVYLILAVSAIQGGAFAVEGAARQAARVFVQGQGVDEATAAAERAVQFALSDYGIDSAAASVTITCSPRPDECLTRRGFVTVVVVVREPLPFAPPLLDADVALSVPLSSTATQQVSRLWREGP